MNDIWFNFQSYSLKPFVFLSVKYTRSTKPNDAMYVWLENVNSRGFEVCVKEFLPFDGKHQDTIVVGWQEDMLKRVLTFKLCYLINVYLGKLVITFQRYFAI